MVPDRFTPVIVTPIGASTLPWLGSDKKYHVSYDLQLTNASRLRATLTRVDVVDARRPTTVLASLSGKQLVDAGRPYGDCNRLRLLPSMNARNTALAAGESRALLIDLVFDALDQAPAAVAPPRGSRLRSATWWFADVQVQLAFHKRWLQLENEKVADGWLTFLQAIGSRRKGAIAAGLPARFTGYLINDGYAGHQHLLSRLSSSTQPT